MGLLEKAQVQKSKEKKQDIKIVNEIEIEKHEKKSKSLLEKVKKKKNSQKVKTEKKKPSIKQKKGKIIKPKPKKEKKTDTKKELAIKEKDKRDPYKDMEIVEEKTGFGYKGLGTRRILYNKEKNEYLYSAIEPELNEEEKEIKKELTHLFKMLADVNVSDMENKEKEQFLEDTLEQIVKDNNIQFLNFKPKKDTKKEENKKTEDNEEKDEEKKGLKSLFSKKNKDKTETKKVEKTNDDKKQEKNGLFSVFSKKDNKYKDLTKEEIDKKVQEIKDKIFYHIFRDFLGYGKIDIIMKDKGIEDISCDGHHVPIFIYHKKYDEIASDVKFDDELQLNSFVVKLAQICGKQISVFSPIVDGKLPDGSRLQTTLARTVTRGSTFTIRRFKENPLTPIDLIRFESISVEMAAFFWMAIENGASVLFCGGTASGKTTALNALSLFIPESHKVVSIEDTREINLPHKNWIAGTTRQGFSASDEKTGKDIDMFDLIRAALRQRPKVIMVGEVRGKEAYSLFQAMSTGHTAYSTVHASDIHTLIQRLENPPIELPRALLTSLEIIVFQNAIDIKGKTVRRMTSVTEIVKLDSDTNQLIFMEPYKWVSKTDDRFESSGSSKVLNNIRLQNDWNDLELTEEIEKRMLVLRWMDEKDITDYREVGRIVNIYHKNSDELVKKAKEELG